MNMIDFPKKKFWRFVLRIIAMILIIGASLFLLDYYLNSMIMADAQT